MISPGPPCLAPLEILHPYHKCFLTGLKWAKIHWFHPSIELLPLNWTTCARAGFSGNCSSCRCVWQPLIVTLLLHIPDVFPPDFSYKMDRDPRSFQQTTRTTSFSYLTFLTAGTSPVNQDCWYFWELLSCLIVLCLYGYLQKRIYSIRKQSTTALQFKAHAEILLSFSSL